MPWWRKRRKAEGSQIEAADVDLWKEEEMLPEGARQVRPPRREGEEPDTAGEHGPMAPETARSIEPESERTSK